MDGRLGHQVRHLPPGRQRFHLHLMLLAELVRTSERVASSPGRSAKVDALAALLGQLAPDEIEPGVAFLAGQTRQRRIGIGWATLRSIDPKPAAAPSIEVLELDNTIEALQSLSGPGSTLARRERLGELLGRATEAEDDFIRRLLIGALRQGALEGVMTAFASRPTAGATKCASTPGTSTT